MQCKRGEVYYVEQNNQQTVGSEQRSGRPAIIVSNNENNEHSTCVEMVYLTTKPKADLPTHVRIKATGVTSTALCEQVVTVSKERLTAQCGACSESEMRSLDIALMVSLGLYNTYRYESKEKASGTTAGNEAIAALEKENGELKERVAKSQVELNMLERMYTSLLQQAMSKGA